jgi:hypothetical protein
MVVANSSGVLSTQTIPALTGYVPYTGATANLDLGIYTLSAYNLIINHTSGSGVAAQITKGGNGEALTVVKSSGSGNAASITGGVTLLSELHLTTALADAYIASAATWNAKQNAITLTTTGSSGSATLVGATLNIPTYTLSGLGGVSTARTITINGTTFDLTADRSWSVGTTTGSGSSGQVAYWNGSSSQTGNNNFFWDATNNRLGIGLVNPQRALEIYSATADSHLRLSGNAPSVSLGEAITGSIYQAKFGLATANGQYAAGAVAGDFVIISQTGATIFSTGSIEKMRLSTAGNVSINSTNDTYKFDVTGTGRFSGQLRLESTITNGTYTYTLPSATGTLALTSQIPANPVGGTGTTNYLPKFTGASTIGDSLVFDNGTNVGINQPSPTRTLDILGASGIGTVLKLQGASGTTTYLQMAYNGATNAQSGYIGYNSSSQMQFFTNNTLRATLDASGNLGLGVSTPGNRLVISQSVSTNFGNGGTYIGLGDTENAIGQTVLIGFGYRGSSTNEYPATIGYLATDNGGNQKGALVFGTRDVTTNTAPSERMRLNASGNLGLGVSPSAWSTSFGIKVIDTGSKGSFYASDNDVNVSFNQYFDGTNAVYKTTGAASRFALIGNEFQWRQAPSGTAGNAISFTQAMTLDANGRLGIGATSMTYALQVNDTAGGNMFRFASGSTVLDYYVSGGNPSFGTASNNDLRFRTNDTTRLTIASTGAATFSSSVTANGLYANAGNSARFYRGANDYYWSINNDSNNFLNFGTFAANGTAYGTNPKMILLDNGNVGIGTSSPSEKLDVIGGAVAAGNGTIRTGITYSSLGLIGTFTNHDLGVITNGTERMRITSGGLVNILSDSTNTTFTGSGALAIKNAASEPFISWHSNTGTRLGFIQMQSAGTAYFSVQVAQALAFDTSGAERMRITSGGLVAIGNTSPSGNGASAVLDIGNGSGGTLNLRDTNTGIAEEGFHQIYGGDNRMYFYAGGSGASAYMQFYTNDAERMRITSGGNVGIGTTAPSKPLHVNSTNTNANAQLKLSQQGTTPAAYMGMFSNTFYMNVGGTYDAGWSLDGSFGVGAIELVSFNGGSQINFATAGSNTTPTERMRITSGGNLLVGTTNNLGSDINANSTIRVGVAFGSQAAIIFGDAGTPYWNIGRQGGSANFSISSYALTALTIQPTTGNVGIGTTGPSYKLDVYSGGSGVVLNLQGVDAYNAETGILMSSSRAKISGFLNGSGGTPGTSLRFYTMPDGGSVTERMRITSDGDLLVNATSTTQGAKFYVNGLGAFGSVYVGSLGTGTVYSNGGTLTNTNPSDFRLKNTIKPLTYGLNEVLQLNPKTFYYNDDLTKARLKYGFIAQEVKDVMPDMVRRLGSDNDYLGLENEGIFVTLVNAIKEQQAQINELKSQLNK